MADFTAQPHYATDVPGHLNPAASVADGTPAAPKRRSTRSEPRRRYECTWPRCGRTYSRAEHLYRHQLNHDPKEIFRCDYPGCDRTFVRQDLCLRHRERHENRAKSASSRRRSSPAAPLSPRSSCSADAPPSASPGCPAPDAADAADAPGSKKPSATTPRSPIAQRLSFTGDAARKPTDLQAIVQPPFADPDKTANHADGQGFARPVATVSRQSFAAASQTPASQYAQLPTVPPLGALHPSHAVGTDMFTGLDASMMDHEQINPTQALSEGPPDPYLAGSANTPFPIQSMGEPAFNDSPLSTRDEFTAWLFQDAGGLSTASFSLASQAGMGFAPPAHDLGHDVSANLFGAPALENAYPGIMLQPQPESTSTLYDFSGDTMLLSHAKRESLITLLKDRFNEGDNAVVGKLKEEIFRGHVDADDHALSMRSMRHFIGSYWYHFHTQMPILHQPTFAANDIHEYLLLAIMAIGAAFMNKAHGRVVTDAAAQLATFIAWHLRWQVFMHTDFHPPTKLWVFQTLLLLEVYEKMTATRPLHERSNIHCVTTINLMRRGTALIDTAYQDAARGPATPKEWWARWITAEATRRAAFAAFYLDALHATMFGHRAVMVVHEVRLPLPCDDALWSATSAAEVGRVEASLHANGVKPTTFVDGLKKILTGQKVRTNTFGRMILMAGLLSVSWHMNQRDLQVSSLGVSQAMGVPDRWRSPLSKAYDFWKKDFDDNLEHMRRASLPWQRNDVVSPVDDTLQAANVHYHLSHVSMHLDVLDCQVFAGIKRLFGRDVSHADYQRAKAKILEWAKGSGARVAVYHAYQLLRSVILPTTEGSGRLYNARDDHLLIRPWSVYMAGLTVWSYGFALDGVLRTFPNVFQPASSPGGMSVMSYSSGRSILNTTHDGNDYQMESVVKDAHVFLQTVGAVRSPQQLDLVRDGRNNLVGVLAILDVAFRDSRWELLHEASRLLRNAIGFLRGAPRF